MNKYCKIKKNDATLEEIENHVEFEENMELQHSVPEWFKRQMRIMRAEVMSCTAKIINNRKI